LKTDVVYKDLKVDYKRKDINTRCFTSNREIENVLKSIYYDAKNPNSFSTAAKLYKAAKEDLPKLTLKDVNDWLSGEFTHTLHKPVRKFFRRNPIIVETIDQQWEADLVDMQEFKNKNKGFNYILTVIDVLSKYAWAIPLKDKRGVSIVKAFELIINDKRTPVFLRTDQGKEFLNKDFKLFLKNYDIRHFTSKDHVIKCAIVERFNRTLKGRMFKYFTSKGTRVWYNIIEDLISAYNNTKHRSIKMTPVQAIDTKPEILFKNVYGVEDRNELFKMKYKNKLKIGDTVRKKYELGVFDKSYYPNWTDQTFKVSADTDQPVKPVYKLKDETNKVLENRVYPEQVQKITENIYRVEKIIKKRTFQGKRQVYVKWLNYPNTYNTWIDENEIQKL
jgi:hypothetical protein